jgi:hypothetical protein
VFSRRISYTLWRQSDEIKMATSVLVRLLILFGCSQQKTSLAMPTVVLEATDANLSDRFRDGGEKRGRQRALPIGQCGQIRPGVDQFGVRKAFDPDLPFADDAAAEFVVERSVRTRL